MTSGASAPYNSGMKRAAATVALVLGALTVAGSTAAVQPRVSRSQAIEQLTHALGARPEHVRLVWADERLTDVVLEWMADSPRARIRVEGGPAGGPSGVRYFRGPAEAWLAADGGPPIGVGSIRPPRGHHVLPRRSYTIPVSLVSTLARDGAPVRLVPLRLKPTISRVKAISKLRTWGDRRGRLDDIWLVRLRHGTGRERLAWMAVTLHARVPVYGCDGKQCKPWYMSPLASFVDARTGKGIEALTINGWKPQHSTTAGTSSVPSFHADLRLTNHVPCGGHRVDRRTLRHFHAVSAVTCVSGMRTYPGQGQWEVLVRKVAVGSVSRVQRFYEKPDQLHQPPKGTMCSDVLVSLPVATFVDAQGRWETPARYPRDRCGQPLGYPPPLHWHLVAVHKVKLVVSAPALAAHCAMRVGNTVAWAGPPRNSTGGPLFDVPPWRARVCIYRTPSNNFATGNFVRGFRLSVAQTRRLIQALDRPGPRRGCPKQRTFAEVGASVGNAATVELGGCYRVERPDRLAGTAKPVVIRAILGRP